jgi:hypothetical protein
MANIDQLINSGFYRIGDWKNSVECTYIVIGVARSGTSILAGALHHLGLFMGDDCARRPAFEDPNLRTHILANDWQSARNLIAKYDKIYPKWGTKIPALIDHLELAHSSFRNPRYIIIYRDIFSIANRNRISMKTELIDGMQRALQDYQKINGFIIENRPTALLVSQCSALHDKNKLIKELVEFCSLNPSDKQIAKSLEFIKKDPENYLQLSRVTKSEGQVLSIENNYIKGWARYLNNDNVPTVVLSIDGREVARSDANLLYSENTATGLRSKGYCGFALHFNGSKRLSKSKISVRVSDDIDNLPYDVSETDFSIDIADKEQTKSDRWRSLIRKILSGRQR